MIKGFDISHYQSYVDFKAIKSAGFDFVIIKASQGVNLVDDMYKKHYQAAREAGLIIGAYHFQDADYDGFKQYNFFKSCINGTNPDFYALDIEELNKIWTPNAISNTAKAFMLSVDKPTLIYCRAYYVLEYSPQMLSWINNYPLWLAYYGKVIPHETVLLKDLPQEAPFTYWTPSGWPFKTTKWWQWSGDTYSIKEHDGALDLDTYNGTLDELKAWCKYTPTPEPEPIPTTDEEGFTITTLQGMNIRSKPNTSSSVIGSLSKGSTKNVLDINGNDVWIKINSNPEQWVCYRQGTNTYLTLARK
jgi:lysozyme